MCIETRLKELTEQVVLLRGVIEQVTQVLSATQPTVSTTVCQVQEHATDGAPGCCATMLGYSEMKEEPQPEPEAEPKKRIKKDKPKPEPVEAIFETPGDNISAEDFALLVRQTIDSKADGRERVMNVLKKYGYTGGKLSTGFPEQNRAKCADELGAL